AVHFTAPSTSETCRSETISYPDSHKYPSLVSLLPSLPPSSSYPSLTMSAPLQLRTHYPIPTRNRVPSNITVRGFNDPMDRWLGFPPDALFTPGAREKFRDFGRHLDPRRNATFVRHDLALKYYYETVEEWLIEGEWRSFPITHTVYRRDRELLRTEIEDYLRHKTIPARYPPRVGDGVIHEPMNQDNFERMMSRFSLRSIILTFSPPRFRPFTMTVERLYERSSGLEVQHHHLDFEERFWSSVYFKQYTEPGYFQRATAASIIQAVRDSGRPYWFVDAELRAGAHHYRVLTGEHLRFQWHELSDKV
ncbi:hypothetical protein C8R46DRAFT_1244967, partial [Mycena filopes]